MSVHQLKDGRWIIQFREENGGKLKREYFGRGPEAEKVAFERNEQLGLRPYKRAVQGHSAFFNDLVNAYADSRSGIVQESTLVNFMWKMDGIILPELGHVRAMNITHKRADKYVKKRIQKVKRTTVHRELSDIKAVLNWSAKRTYIAFNPLRDYEMPKRDDAVILPPSPAEIDAILKHAPDRLIRAISLSYYTGLRPGQRELYSLKWSDVDFSAGTILVTSAKKGGHFKYRLVPIHPDFVKVLKRWHKADENPVDADEDSAGPIVHYRKKPVKTLKKIFKQTKEKAKITRRLRMYDFRHAFATLLLRHHADLKSTSELLGHSRTDTTTRIYQHVDFEMHKEAIGLLPVIDLDIQNVLPKSPE